MKNVRKLISPFKSIQNASTMWWLILIKEQWNHLKFVIVVAALNSHEQNENSKNRRKFTQKFLIKLKCGGTTKATIKKKIETFTH